MSQSYHTNAKTVSKWKNRTDVVDKSSRPDTIKRSLTNLEREVIRVVKNINVDGA